MIFLYLYIVVIFIRPQDWIGALEGLPVSYLLIPAGILFGLVKSRGNLGALKFPQHKFFILYLFVILLSVSLTYMGSSRFIPEMTKWVQRGLLYYLVILIINTEEDLQKAIFFCIVVIGIIGVQGIQQAKTGVGWGGMTPDPDYEEIRVRWIGDWDGPNVYALILSTAAIMATEIFASYRSVLMRIGALLLIAVLSVATYYTNSRGAVLGAFCGFAFLVISRSIDDKKKIIKMLVVAALVIAVVFQFLPSRMQTLSSGESAAHERTWMWEKGLSMLRENPILGIGKEQFAWKTGLRAHNNYVQVFAETGLLGFFAWMGIIWFSFKGMLLREFREISDSLFRLLRILLCGFATYCAVTFFVTMENDSLFILLGLLGSAYKVGLIAAGETDSEFALTMKLRDMFMIGTCMVAVYVLVWLVSIEELV